MYTSFLSLASRADGSLLGTAGVVGFRTAGASGGWPQVTSCLGGFCVTGALGTGGRFGPATGFRQGPDEYSRIPDNPPTLLTKRIQLSASHRCAAPDPRRDPPSRVVGHWRSRKRMLYCRRVDPWRERLLVIEYGSQMDFHRRDIFNVVPRAFVHGYSAKRATVSVLK